MLLAVAATILAAFPAAVVRAAVPYHSAAGQTAPANGSQFLSLVPRWFVETSAPPSGPPVIAGGLVILPLTPSGIVAYHLSDGKEAWRADIAAVHPVSVDEEHAYVVSPAGMHALRVASGEEVWRADTGTLTAPPLVHGGWIVLATADNVAALRAADGAAVWRRTIGTVEARPAIDGDWLFLPLLLETRLVAVDLQTGAPRWETELGGPPDEPLALGGLVYVSARDKHFYALDARDGGIRWIHRIGAAPRGAAAVDEDHVYVVALDNVLRALNRGDGAIKWTKELAYRPSRGPMLVGRTILVPGAVASLPVFSRSGAALTPVTFRATVIGLSNVIAGAYERPEVAAATGDLQHAWALSLLETSIDPPPLPLVPLTAVPGGTIPIALPV